MKVLFLDIDGVLNSEQFIRHRLLKGDPYQHKDMDPYAVSNLQFIAHHVKDLKIIISSTWRVLHPLEEIKEMMTKSGFDSSELIIGCTPDGRRGPRGAEIDQWLKENPGTESFVIIDDDSDMEPHLERLIKTSSLDGLLLSQAKRAVMMLTGMTPKQVHFL